MPPSPSFKRKRCDDLPPPVTYDGAAATLTIASRCYRQQQSNNNIITLTPEIVASFRDALDTFENDTHGTFTVLVESSEQPYRIWVWSDRLARAHLMTASLGDAIKNNPDHYDYVTLHENVAFTDLQQWRLASSPICDDSQGVSECLLEEFPADIASAIAGNWPF